ncbi:MAG: polysaccharide deacetylase family protein, partial [Candidatus Diapherotrites archaeon]|nr:polysaccharide deacetylase family protein [Candidatus Diapherotrites archaeon]
RGVRVIVANCIRRLFELRGLPLPHLWYYPKQFKSVFGFHIDMDYFDADTLKTIALMNRLRVDALWFLNMEAAENSSDPKIMQELLCQRQIGQHGYRHAYYSDQQQSHENAIKGDKAARKSGAKPNSFSAPNGVWNNGIGSAVAQLGYDFAMGFGLDQDNLPFNPIVSGKEAPYLFLPSHPICIAMLKAYDFCERDMLDYFKTVIGRNIALGIPLFFYSHPFKEIARFPRVVETIATEARRRGDVWEASHLDFVRWWKKRQGFFFTAQFDGKAVSIKCAAAPDASIAVVSGGKRFFLRAKSQKIKLSSLRGGEKLFDGFVHDTVPRASPFGKKYLAKKLAGHGMNLIRKIRKNIGE